MALNARAVAISCACLMAITCAFYIVSNVGNEWGSLESIVGISTIGLWRECLRTVFATGCSDFSLNCSDGTHMCGKVAVSRAFVTIACIISGLSALSLFVCGLIRKDSQRSVIIVSEILPIVSFIAGLIGVAVGIAFVLGPDLPLKLNLATSAILGIVAVVINAITAVIAIILVR